MRRALALHTRPDTEGDDAVEGIIRKDRHVVSAALIHDADVVVTNDRRLLHEIDALGRSLRTASDQLLNQLACAFPSFVTALDPSR